MGPIGVPELLVIFVIALIVFGPKKLPDLGRSLGKSINEFKRASNELRNTLEEEVRIEEQKDARKALAGEVASASPTHEPAVHHELSPTDPSMIQSDAADAIAAVQHGDMHPADVHHADGHPATDASHATSPAPVGAVAFPPAPARRPVRARPGAAPRRAGPHCRAAAPRSRDAPPTASRRRACR